MLVNQAASPATSQARQSPFTLAAILVAIRGKIEPVIPTALPTTATSVFLPQLHQHMGNDQSMMFKRSQWVLHLFF